MVLNSRWFRQLKRAVQRTALKREIRFDFGHNVCSSKLVGYKVIFILQLAYSLLTAGHVRIPGVKKYLPSRLQKC